jgi:hypothetical protein
VDPFILCYLQLIFYNPINNVLSLDHFNYRNALWLNARIERKMEIMMRFIVNFILKKVKHIFFIAFLID